MEGESILPVSFGTLRVYLLRERCREPKSKQPGRLLTSITWFLFCLLGLVPLQKAWHPQKPTHQLDHAPVSQFSGGIVNYREFAAFHASRNSFEAWSVLRCSQI